MEVRTRQDSWLAVPVVLLFLFPTGCIGGVPPSAPLDVSTIVYRMVAMNRARAEALGSYASTCVYHVQNDDHNQSADLVVKVVYRGPNQQQTTVVSESGSDILRTRVLSRLMEGEQEALQEVNRRRTDLNSENYNFRLVGYEQPGQHEIYVLEVSPKIKSKFIFEGRIWVSADDFAVVRMEGAPAKNPSWWTTHIDVSRSYCKVGDFWLPSRNETVAQVRLFGRSVLTIVYKDYKLLQAQSVRTPALLTAMPLGVAIAKN